MKCKRTYAQTSKSKHVASVVIPGERESTSDKDALGMLRSAMLGAGVRQIIENQRHTCNNQSAKVMETSRYSWRITCHHTASLCIKRTGEQSHLCNSYLQLGTKLVRLYFARVLILVGENERNCRHLSFRSRYSLGDSAGLGLVARVSHEALGNGLYNKRSEDSDILEFGNRA